MTLTQQHLRFLKSWAYEELHDLHGPAHQLQKAQRVDSAPLTAMFRAWAEHNALDVVAVTLILNSTPEQAITWPWETIDEFLDCCRTLTQATPFRQCQAVA
jgi:hypothetical protein